VQWRVAFEKPNLSKLVEKNFALGCPTNDFLVFQTFCIHQILAVWEKTGLFQQPRDISPVEGYTSRSSFSLRGRSTGSGAAGDHVIPSVAGPEVCLSLFYCFLVGLANLFITKQNVDTVNSARKLERSW
jgi:hypothetical protein